MGTSSVTATDFVAGPRGATTGSPSPAGSSSTRFATSRSVSLSAVLGLPETGHGPELIHVGKPARSGSPRGGHGHQGQERQWETR